MANDHEDITSQSDTRSLRAIGAIRLRSDASLSLPVAKHEIGHEPGRSCQHLSGFGVGTASPGSGHWTRDGGGRRRAGADALLDVAGMRVLGVCRVAAGPLVLTWKPIGRTLTARPVVRSRWVTAVGDMWPGARLSAARAWQSNPVLDAFW